jgi:hypothetical protein
MHGKASAKGLTEIPQLIERAKLGKLSKDMFALRAKMESCEKATIEKVR